MYNNHYDLKNYEENEIKSKDSIRKDNDEEDELKDIKNEEIKEMKLRKKMTELKI